MKKQIILLIMACMSAIAVQAQTVHCTSNGTKYHKSECRYLTSSKKAISLDSAKLKKMTPCKVCFKDQSNRCTGKTKSGNQCKRTAVKGKAKCYQH